MTRANMRIVISILILVSAALTGCDRELPTSPKAAVTASVSTSAARRRAVPPGVRQVPPPCAAPAPFHEVPEAAPGYIVEFKDGVDTRLATARLAAKLGFTPLSVYTAVLGGFYACMPLQTVAALRCEPEVASIWENPIGHIGASPEPEAR